MSENTGNASATPSVIRVVVSSTNPVKVPEHLALRSLQLTPPRPPSPRCQVESTRRAFCRTFPASDIHMISLSVPSGVPDQPMGDAQTRQGALNRACNARDSAAARGDAVDFCVGLEGGCVFEAPVELPSPSSAHEAPHAAAQELSCFAWGVVIKPGSSKVGLARTASFQLPDAVAQLVSQVALPSQPSCVSRLMLLLREWSLELRMTKCLVESTASAKAGRSGCCLVV